jgi:hypothetical protein
VNLDRQSDDPFRQIAMFKHCLPTMKIDPHIWADGRPQEKSTTDARRCTQILSLICVHLWSKNLALSGTSVCVAAPGSHIASPHPGSAGRDPASALGCGGHLSGLYWLGRQEIYERRASSEFKKVSRSTSVPGCSPASPKIALKFSRPSMLRLRSLQRRNLLFNPSK